MQLWARIERRPNSDAEFRWNLADIPLDQTRAESRTPEFHFGPAPL
jgi:hypothetical protein